MTQSEPQSPEAIWSQPMRLAELPARKPTRFDLSPDAPTRKAIAKWADILGVDALRFKGELRPNGRSDWELVATFTATVVQECVITLAPVTTEISETVSRRYLAHMEMPTDEEAEMPEDDSAEPLPSAVDLAGVALEVLELALPQYPRAPGAELGDTRITEPGAEPLDEDQMKPFANLRNLLQSRDEDEK
ncbi:MAG: DUF177 domain-containing protein [Rhodobacteraceae bacterium]|nr:DUF177 domain-containing protein [Paracoccaceae bacterium]